MDSGWILFGWLQYEKITGYDLSIYNYNSWNMICTKFAYKEERLANNWVELDDTWTDVGFLSNKVCLSPVSRARSKVVIITVSIDGCN